jgi:ribose transport system permease protein
MTLVIVTGGIDLSAGSVLALSGAVFGLLLTSTGMPIAAAAFGALDDRRACGLVNGSVTVRWRLPSFLVTLAMLEWRAAARTSSRTRRRSISARAWTSSAQTSWPGLTAPVLLAVA